MPFYTYKARDEQGRLLKGRVEAEDAISLRKSLEQRGLLIIRYSQEKKPFGLKLPPIGRFVVSGKDLLTFTIQLAHSLTAGVSILTALSFVIEECKNERFKNILMKIYEDLKGGSSFSGALSRHSVVFSPFFVSMIELGESSGSLSDVLYRLADYFKREKEIKSKTITAMIYPAVITCATFGIIAFLLTFIFPKFVQMFTKANVPLPLPTRILLTISILLKGYWYLLIIFIIGIIVASYFIYSIPRVRFMIDKGIMRIPILGDVIKKIHIFRFADGLGVLYSSGLSITKAMYNLEKIFSNRFFADMVAKLRNYLFKGGDISQYLKTTGLFSSDIIGMIRAGEETGTLDDILKKVSDIYYDEINETVARTISVMEPLLIVFLGISIGFIAVSLLLPVFRLVRVVR